MIVYKLFTKKILKVQIQETDPISWAEKSESKRKAHGGKFCTLCPRYKKRSEVLADGSEVVKAITLKPIATKATDAGDKRTVMVVVDATSASKSVTGMVDEIRKAGFGGRIVIDFVTKCGGGRVDQVKDQHINKCRPHLAYTYHATVPDLVLLCGTRSTKAFLGETVSVHKNRDLWQVMFEGGRQIPVVMTQSPIDAAGNFLLRKQMRRDLHFLFNTDWDSYRLPQGEVREVETEEDAYEALKWAKQAEWLAYDTETTGRAFKGTMEILCVAFATTSSNVCYVFSAKSLENRYIRGCVEKILTKCWLVGHNIKFDQHSVREGLGVEAKRVLGCTRLMHKLINSDADASLEQLGRLVGIGNHKREMDPEVKRIASELKATAKKQAGRDLKKHEFDPMSEAYGHVDLKDLHRYCALDTYVTAMLYDRCYDDLVNHDFLLETWTDHQLLANNFFYRMEMRGMPTSARNIKIANKYVSKKVEESYEKIALLTEFKLDPDKPASIAKYLKDNDLDTGKRTETGKMSTTAKDLKKLREKSTTIAHLLDYRKSSKLLHSYIETLPHYIGEDGCVHPSILVDGTRAGGRVSCIAEHQEITTSIGKVSFASLANVDLLATPVYVTTHTGAHQRMTKVWSTGVRATVRVVTSNGHEIECTADHRLLTEGGWVQAADCLGKRVKVIRRQGVVEVSATEEAARRVHQDVACGRGVEVRVHRDEGAARESVGVGFLSHAVDVAGCAGVHWADTSSVVQVVQDTRQEVRRTQGGEEVSCGECCADGQQERGGGENKDTVPRGCGRGADVPRGDVSVADGQAHGPAGISGAECTGFSGGGSGLGTGEPDWWVVGTRPGQAGPVSGCSVCAAVDQGQSEKKSHKGVPGVVGRELGASLAAPPAEAVQEDVQGALAGVLRTSEVRGRERAGRRTLACKDTTREAGESALSEHAEGGGLRGERGTRGGGGRFGPQQEQGARRASVEPVPGHGVPRPESTGGGREAEGGHGDAENTETYFDLVVSVEPAGECEVYDFTVPGDASAMIGGIAAHNCRDPAMQTIPSGKDDLEMSKMVKSCFIAQPTEYGADDGEMYVIISADFKTLEIYVGAAWSNDKVMLSALRSGKDFHIHTAMGIAPFVWKQTPEEVYAEIMRDLASPTGSSPKRTLSKRLTFSTMYRMGAHTLAEELGVPVTMAQDMITAFFKLNQGLSDRMDESLKHALKTGYVYAEWDGKPFRQRPLTHIGYRDSYRNGSAERASMNTPIQSQAADICTRAAMELEATFLRELPKNEAWIALTIHDSINVMARYRSADKVMKMMRDVMTSQPCGDVKLVVDIEIGKTWGSMISEKAWRNGEEIKAA